ncbi:MAG: Disulfide bond isomerase, DsbC/G-like protein [Gammaproteobacteria bacterium]|nr:Disulfide bond isomerase, DsbC/G-like protein [Gammaproteobacteria bacterium]
MPLIRRVVLPLAALLCATLFVAARIPAAGVPAAGVPAAAGTPAVADDVPADVAAKIRATLHERIPELRVAQIRKAPLAGLYEINTGQELLYTNDAATMIFAGRIVDTKSREDLTAQRWNEINAIDFSSLPFDLAIKSVKGNGSRKLVVFADPLCPYCRQLEQEMQGLNNVTVYTFLYPLETIHPGSTAKAVQIWCSKDRSDAWSKWMLQKVEPASARCDSAPVAKLQALGDKLRIDSTPTLFLADGRRARGAIKHDELEHLLADVHK